jgi:hypothetical protein
VTEVSTDPAGTAKLAGRIQNYELIKGEFGGYKKGAVLAEFALRQAGNLEEMVARRTFVPTTKAVNVDIRPPKVSAAPDVTKDVYGENTTLRQDRDRLQEENVRLDKFIKATANRENDLKESLAGHIAENGHLKRVIAQQEADIADIKKQYETLGLELLATQRDLEAATAPATKADAKKK